MESKEILLAKGDAMFALAEELQPLISAAFPDSPERYKILQEIQVLADKKKSAYRRQAAAVPEQGEGEQFLPAFPDLPSPLIQHEKLGALFDRVQMHMYAVKYRDLAPVAQSLPIRQGWKLVPIEPTAQMITAGNQEVQQVLSANRHIGPATCATYSAMLAAAPQSPGHTK